MRVDGAPGNIFHSHARFCHYACRCSNDPAASWGWWSRSKEHKEHLINKPVIITRYSFERLLKRSKCNASSYSVSPRPAKRRTYSCGTVCVCYMCILAHNDYLTVRAERLPMLPLMGGGSAGASSDETTAPQRRRKGWDCFTV